MAASSSTSDNRSSSSNSSYDVFISHRGPDVKKTFASFLYHRLDSCGLKVFLDQEELERGDDLTSQIEGAIQTASLHVAIFSAGYAGSPWCLNELVSMLKTKKPIIPVFYKVKPDALRWTHDGKGVYAEAIRKLEEKRKDGEETPRHDPATVEGWRKALSSVAGISGFELEAFNGDKGVLLEKVVDSVWRKVRTPLNVAKYPTGLDEKVRDFENKVLWQHQQSGRRTQVAGIVGLGGIGKTTLAKELFNRKSSHYKRSCFLGDVREYSLISLQKKLLNRLTGSDLQVDNKDEGIGILKRHLLSSEILLVLDDVDRIDQVDALLPEQNSLHPNTLILITSRNRDVLTKSGIQELSIYKLDGLGEQHSLDLFCRHAFSQPYPSPGFETLTHEFLKACGGLPLSLKVIGAHLHGNNDTSSWEGQLKRLKNTLPDEIQERLKISYEALNVEEKNIFLDIACFFIGEDRDIAIGIWKASGWQGRLGLENLQKKCLVEVVLNEIRMHDHLRDLGRSEAHVSPPLRFWRIDELLQQTSLITVRGIRLDRLPEDEFEDDEFDTIQMRGFQLVHTYGYAGSILERILPKVKSPNLICLRWTAFPYSSLPPWIPVKKLKVFHVSWGGLETLQVPLISLEELRVEHCWNLRSIRGLEQATKLRRLHVGGCSDLEELPNMERLVSLEELEAGKCWKLRSIRGLEQATKLRRLHVGGCSDLEELPNMERLVSLEELEAWECRKLRSIRGLEQATKLRRLHVGLCSNLEELPNMETLVSLEELEAWRCVKLRSIRGLEQATKLRWLHVGSCWDLEELPNMERLVSLEELEAGGCRKLRSIRGLEQATKLRRLHVGWCWDLEELPNMERLVSLEELLARGCEKLRSIRGLEQATKLRRLHVGGCSDLEELPNMERLVSLEELEAGGCWKLRSIRGLEQATKLRRLHVDWCSDLEELPNMERLVSLEALWAEGCVKLKSIRGLLQCTELRTLDVRGCSELEALEGVEGCGLLEEYYDDGCHKLQCEVWEY